MKEQLTITISGKSNTGKSHLSYLLNKFLNENGYNTKHEIPSDYLDEDHFDRSMSENFDEVMEMIRDKSNIVIREEQELVTTF